MIYFIREGKYPDTSVKIGVTNSNPQARCNELQTGNSKPLVVAWEIPGDVVTEKLAQEFFKDCHVRGEWYQEDEAYDRLFFWFQLGVMNICSDTNGKGIAKHTSEESKKNAIETWLSHEINYKPNQYGGRFANIVLDKAMVLKKKYDEEYLERRAKT